MKNTSENNFLHYGKTLFFQNFYFIWKTNVYWHDLFEMDFCFISQTNDLVLIILVIVFYIKVFIQKKQILISQFKWVTPCIPHSIVIGKSFRNNSHIRLSKYIWILNETKRVKLNINWIHFYCGLYSDFLVPGNELQLYFLEKIRQSVNTAVWKSVWW